ncbi:MAG: sensor histidine kinase [Candidatus Thorarchaeota archaeon]
MQYLPIEFVLESSAIFAGVIFALVALFGIYYYSTDIQYRRWALTHLSFWIAFLPPNLFVGLPYIGDFFSMVLKVYASILLLRAFNYRRLSNIRNSVVHPTIFVGIALFWLLVSYFGLPSNTSAIPTSMIMAFTFFYVAREILYNKKDRSKIWISAGVSYLLWAVASLPMILLPLSAEVIIAGYVQFIAQAAVMITMFLAFIGSTRRRVVENLRLTTIFASMLSHDLRNFLNVAQGAVDLVQVTDDESVEMLETVQKSLSSAADFMNRIRSAWIDLGSHSNHVVDLDLCEVVNDVASRAIKEHSLRVEQIVTEGLERCYVSTTPLISQVIWNIVDNSIRHAHGNPEIEIFARASNSIILAISDRSGGLSHVLKKKLLSDEEVNNGFGIGLMLVKEITSIYGIPIEVEDRVENDEVVGLTFRLLLPHSGGVPTKKEI